MTRLIFFIPSREGLWLVSDLGQLLSEIGCDRRNLDQDRHQSQLLSEIGSDRSQAKSGNDTSVTFTVKSDRAVLKMWQNL